MFNKKEIEEKHIGASCNTSAEVLYAIDKIAEQKVSEWTFTTPPTSQELKDLIEEEAQEIWNYSKYEDEVLAALPLNFSNRIVFYGSVFAEFKNGKWQRRHATIQNYQMSHEEVRKEYAKSEK